MHFYIQYNTSTDNFYQSQLECAHHYNGTWQHIQLIIDQQLQQIMESGIPLQTERTFTHHMLCCCITTLTFYIFNKILKSVTLIGNIRAP